MSIRVKPEEKVWADFQEQEKLSDQQVELFKMYERYLSKCNEEFNLTAIKDLSGIVRQHFQDSLSLAKFVDLSKIKSICDIGTGAGFPAIPLKIMFPHLNVYLIEVTKKKIQFLIDLISMLELTDIEICDLDWRTFLRKTEFDIDMFVTRAAIDEVELIRMLKPSCFYNKATIAYWAAEHWECHTKAKEFVNKIESYKLGQKNRKLVFFKLISV
ncbi:MAG: 16S rRNA (guanine(527)-N(7))-methyltransferase RsmG [Candidatus Babeliales bacterium]|jgi:16S rRNA (guanine527-N7)-methyltransferase|nr:MAG: Ribosomal RNA small subunit methyltransferase G [candidate division TM6 bacterium GW2011_GWF2_36_6]